MNIFPILAKHLEKEKLKFSRTAPFHTKSRVSPNYPVSDWRPTTGTANHGCLGMARARAGLTIPISLNTKLQLELATTYP